MEKRSGWPMRGRRSRTGRACYGCLTRTWSTERKTSASTPRPRRLNSSQPWATTPTSTSGSGGFRDAARGLAGGEDLTEIAGNYWTDQLQGEEAAPLAEFL